MSDPTLVLYKENDQYVKVAGVKNAVTNVFVNDAVLKANLYDSTNVLVAGAIDISLDYVAASNGDYIGYIVGASFNPTKGSGYLLRITSDDDSITLQRKVVVAERTS